MGRPGVSVVVPFLGDAGAAERARRHLARLELGPDDELIVADNTPEAIGEVFGESATVVRAAAERSSYHARNAGARRGRAEWILFLDADCAPEPELLQRYFAPGPHAGVGALGGTIVDHSEHASLLARYAVSRHLYCAEHGLQRDNGYAPTANLLVRRLAFEQLGGFTEGIRSGGDVDLCWRIQAAGWLLERRPEARVAHRHRERLPPFLGMLARYGAGARWLDHRYPGSSPRWPLSASELGRSGLDATRHFLRGDRDEAAFRLVDAIGLVAHNVGYRSSNSVPAR